MVAIGLRTRFVGQRRGQFDVATQHIVDGAIGQRRRFLRDRCNAQTRGHVQRTGVGFNLAQDRREQAGLAAAIAPGHADFPAVVQRCVDALEQQTAATAQRKIAEGDHT